MESSLAAPAETVPDDYLPRVKKMFTEWSDLTREARRENTIDIDYYDGIQLTAGEKLTLSKRGQPDIIINRIRPAINGILGVVGKGKSEPRAFPRTPKDEPSADVATDTLRFIADSNRFDQLKVRAFKDMLVPGTMAVQVPVKADMQVSVDPIRWEEFIYDPKSRREDFSDAAYLGIASWKAADDLKAMYADKADEIESAVSTGPMGSGGADEFTADRPGNAPTMWVDRKRRRLFVVEIYHREAGSWKRCVYINTVVLVSGDSPYHDDKGQPTCIIEAASAYVDRENNRYGASRDMRDVQDEINKRRSKALHYLNTRQIQEAAPGMGMENVDEARAEASKPDGALPSGWQVVPQTDQVQGQLELLREAKSEIERLGPNPAILGREGTDSSGRALLARQQSGLVELDILFGIRDDWELRVYRQMWARAKQFWRGEQYVRVTDDEGAPKFVGLNQPKGSPVMGMDGQPVMDPETGEPQETQPQFNEAGESVFGYKNQIAEMNIDIILDSTPDTANIQQEQFQDLMQLVGSNPTYAQSVPFEMMLELSTVPHKRELIDKLKKYREEGQQAQAQQAQMAAQMAGQQAEAETRKLHADASLSEAKAHTEALKPQMDAIKLGIDAHNQDQPPPGLTGVPQFGA